MSQPRVVVVTRETEYELLLARHATRDQASFFLTSRGQSLEQVEARHQSHHQALRMVSNAIPVAWRRNRVTRSDLDRFLFEPEDSVVVVGQDGLVANVARYLDGQPVLGVNPNPAEYDGILVPLSPESIPRLLPAAVERRLETEARTMVEARLDDGQTLVALNELFVGHRSHQSARYRLRDAESQERQSSSGIIVTTGTGATGWARSINRQRRTPLSLPEPGDRELAFFVREAFPSVSSGTLLVEGTLRQGQRLSITSEMNQGGVIFGDGMEEDRLEFPWGSTVSIGVSGRCLELVRG